MNRVLNLGEGFGLELEYMVVDLDTLDVRPIVDQLIQRENGQLVNEIEGRDVGWSNELALHVIELKNLDPTFPWAQFRPGFRQEVEKINAHLERTFHCQLLPTAMHPWMNPQTDSELWPHGNQVVYRKYNEIFGCSGHGWTNLQSAHLNFSFADEGEFRRLHRALRLTLPLIPVVAASSPFWEGKRGPDLDTRLHVYFNNQKKIPEIMGVGIPEDVFSPEEYENAILKPMYRAIAPYDPQGILQHEWLNSRAVIPKFKYGCLEVRLMDIQECPEQDISLAAFFRRLVEKLISETWTEESQQGAVDSLSLRDLLISAIHYGGQAVFSSPIFLQQFGLRSEKMMGHELIEYLVGQLSDPSSPLGGTSNLREDFQGVKHVLDQGTLAERLIRANGPRVSRASLLPLYQELAKCLKKGVAFSV